jgi:hypothetical protein
MVCVICRLLAYPNLNQRTSATASTITLLRVAKNMTASHERKQFYKDQSAAIP